MFYVIAPPEKSAWSMPRDRLIMKLTRDWPEFAIHGPEPGLPTRDLVWATRDGAFEGSQDVAGRVQYMSGTDASVARYAAWWRRQVDPSHTLVLYDESYTVVVSLEPGATEESILSALDQR